MKEFRKPSLYKPLFISAMLLFINQSCGIAAIIFYTVDIFQTAAPSIDANMAGVIIAVVQVVTTLVAALVMDRVGRRFLLMASGE